MKKSTNLHPSRSFRLRFVPLVAVAVSMVAPATLGKQVTNAKGGLSPDLALPDLLESPPSQPLAAPCGGCGAGCGAGPKGIPSIYLHSGEFHLQEVDLVIPGRGLDFVWARTYRSRIGPDSAQGFGWDFSYNLRIELEGNDVRVMDGNGRADLFRLNAGGTYIAAEFFREGRWEADGSFTLEFSDQGQWNFFAFDGSPLEGKVQTISDRNGNILGFDYDGLGRLNLVVDTLGRQIQVSYDTNGMISSVTDFNGRQVVYTYYQAGEGGGNLGDLKSARSPIVVGTPNANDFPAGKTTTYTYSTGFGDKSLNSNLLTVTDPKGQTWLINEYATELDPNRLLFDRVVAQTRGDQGDLIDITYTLGSPGIMSPLLAIVNDRVGNVREYEFDLTGRCLGLRQFTGRANPDTPTTEASNRPLNQLRGSDPAFFETRWTYNVDSMATSIMYPNGNITQNVYELDLDPQAAALVRGNLRQRDRQPGSHLPVGDQDSLSELFEYDTGLGGCCGSNFITRHTDARGNITQHDYDGNGNRTRTTHRISSIVEDYTYNVYGQMISHLHPDNGQGSLQLDTWTYYGPTDGDQNGYLSTEILDANGFAITTSWVYDPVGNAIQVTDARGNQTDIIVNELNQAVRQISPPVQVMNGTAVRYEVDTFFDENDNVTRVDTKNFDGEGNVDPNPYISTAYDHEILNREISKSDEVSASLNIITEYEYDANRNRTLVRLGEATNGSQPTNVERILFDERDLLFQRTRAEGDPDQSTSQQDYDGNGSLIRITRGLEDAVPRVQTSTIDAYGRAVDQTDPMGNVTLRTFDPNGNLLQVRVDGELCDFPGGSGNVRLFEANYEYDAMDRNTESMTQYFDPATQAPIGSGISSMQWKWTDRSEIAVITDDNGNTTSIAYDSAGRQGSMTDAKGNSIQRTYDANHNVVQSIETDKCDTGGPDEVFVSIQVYDTLDRSVLAQDSLGNEVGIGYDSRGNTSQIVDAIGNVTTQIFDGVNRMLTSTRELTKAGVGGGDPVGKIVRGWNWDDSSRLVSQVDDSGNATAYVYDALSRLVQTCFADGTSESYTYNAHDKIVARVDANATQVAITHDLLNRISARSIIPGPLVSSDTTFEIWKHDGLSRLVYAEDDDSIVTRAWDSLSSIIAEDQNGDVIGCSYDGMRNDISLAYPSGKSVTCTFDELNRVSTISNNGSVATYAYIGPQRVKLRTSNNGLYTSQYGYDGARRVTSVDHLSGATLPVDRRTFTWDAMYNKTKSTDIVSGLVHDYAYDSQYRLTNSTDTDTGVIVRDVEFTFDGVGSRLAVTGGGCAGTYTMDGTLPAPADLQMNQYTNAPCIGSIDYDERGNQVARGGVESLEYDYRNRLVSHVGPNGLTEFAYDALGRNIAKIRINPSETVRYLYHGLDVIEELDGSDGLLASYVRGRSSSAPDNSWAWVGFNPQPEPPIGCDIVEMETLGQRLFFFHDDLGSLRAVTDDLGVVVERYDYDEAGLPAISDGAGIPLAGSAIGNSWLFTGQRFDEETGFYYYNTRFMDPLLGQFLSRDTVGLWGDPVNLGNGRTYVANNFQTLVDPTGMASKTCGGPWPGPKTVYYNYVDCGSNFTIPDALCGAMRGAGRAKRAGQTWLNYEIGGYPGGWSWLVGVPFIEWFGGLDRSISFLRMLVIQSTLSTIYEPFRAGKSTGIECESSCDSGITAYVAWYDSNIHLCPLWMGSTFSGNRRSSILLHEMSHNLSCTDDHFYYFNQTKATTFRLGSMEASNIFETGVLSTNADTYEGLYLDWFVR